MTYEDIRPTECVRETPNGVVRFRSTLEARWSLAFDRLHLEWEYEPKTFPMLSGRLYTPDFQLGSNWIEIKPTGDALRDVEGKLHEFAQTGCPGRFFSFTASFPSFGHIGFPTVIEWLPEGVCWRPKTYAVELFCAEHEFRRDYPHLYVDFVDRVFECVRYAKMRKPVKAVHAMEVD